MFVFFFSYRLSFDLRLLITPFISFNFSYTLSKLHVDIRVDKFDMEVENRISWLLVQRPNLKRRLVKEINELT